MAGEAEARVGDERHAVRGGDIVIVPAGELHGTRDVGSEIVELRAVFPKARVDMEYVERNPAPGTEHAAPGPAVVWNLHSGAVEPLDEVGEGV